MSEPIYNSIQELLDQLKTGCGHTFNELDVNHRLTGIGRNDKGALGKIVEEGVFHYSVNSRAEADFKNLGVELKTTGFEVNRNGLKFKERLPLNTFNYQNVENQEFEDSDMWHKCQQLLIALYQYLEGKTYGEMVLKSGFYHTFPEEDIEVFRKDYEIIRNKIKNGKADTISETDTNYLAACTAGAGHGKLDRTASTHYGLNLKPRKFAIKSGYFTGVLASLFTNGKVEKVIDYNELKTKTIEEIIIDRLTPYLGKTEEELNKQFTFEEDNKSKYERFIAGMLGAKGKVNELDEFQKANITLKTIRVQEDGNIEQNMSFPAFSFTELVDQEWEDSEFRNITLDKKFLLAIFEKNKDHYVFKRIKFWCIPEEIIETHGKKVFEEMKSVLLSGKIVRGFKKRADGMIIRLNNFPKSAANPYIHIRPHGGNRDDMSPLPVPDVMTGMTSYTKQSFWLKKSYLKQIVKED